MEKACLIRTGEDGLILQFPSAAEAFFEVSAAEVLGKAHYTEFHDPEEMNRCQNDPDFIATVERDGFHEGEWMVIPRSGDSFRARVTLIPNFSAEGRRVGWTALYRRL